MVVSAGVCCDPDADLYFWRGGLKGCCCSGDVVDIVAAEVFLIEDEVEA